MTLYTYQSVEDSLRAYAADQDDLYEEGVDDLAQELRSSLPDFARVIAKDNEGKLIHLLATGQFDLGNEYISLLFRREAERIIEKVRAEDEYQRIIDNGQFGVGA